MTSTINLFIESLFILIYGLLIFFIASFILSYFSKRITRNLFVLFGMKGLFYFLNIGVPIHEIGHLVLAIIFRHKINEVKLFNRNPDSDIMGYVRHSYNSRSLYQSSGNFFIGIAPIFSSTCFLIVLLKMLLPELYTSLSSVSLGQGFLGMLIVSMFSVLNLKNFSNIFFYIFLFLAISICSSISLSREDLKGSYIGFIVLLTMMFVVNVVFSYMGLDYNVLFDFLLKINKVFAKFFSVTIVFSFISYVITGILAFLFK